MEIAPLSLIIPSGTPGTGPNLQAAVNQAAATPRAGVWIPADYAGTDTYTNPSSVPIFDLRGSGSVSFTAGSGITSVSSLPATCTPGGTNAEVNFTGSPNPGLNPCVATNQFAGLTSFFGKFFGLAPQDYGAKGDTHVIGVCSMTLNIATVTCSNNPFTAADVGKQFEMVCAGGAANPIQGTITAFTSSSVVNTSVSCTATQTNVGFAYGSDDTAALQAWIAAMVAAAVQGAPPLTRGGYIPSGGYWTTKRLAFIYPGGQDKTTGEAAPAPNNSGTQLRSSLWLMGAGTDNSYFYYPSSFQWQFPSTSADVCGMLINHWDFAQISNFAIQAPLANGASTWNTSTNTGNIGGLCFIDNTHQAVTNLYISGFSNTQGTMPGVNVASDFESSYGYIASEVNNRNWVFNQLETAVSTGVLTSGAFEKILMETIFLENSNAGAFGNLMIGSNSSLKQFRMRNIHFRSDSGSTVVFNVRTSVTIPTGEALICEACRVTDVLGTGHLGIVIQSAGRYSFPELTYINTNTVATSATATAFDLTNVASRVGMIGGEINCVGCTNAVQFGGASPLFYATDVQATAPSVLANFGNSATQVFGMFRTATGWNGPGAFGASTFNTFTNCAVNSASPAACGSAASGAVVVPTTTTTYTVNTTAVTAASRITITPMSFAGNLPSAPTCVVPTTPFIATISAITAGTSFTMTLPSTTGQTCWQYQIVD